MNDQQSTLKPSKVIYELSEVFTQLVKTKSEIIAEQSKGMIGSYYSKRIGLCDDALNLLEEWKAAGTTQLETTRQLSIADIKSVMDQDSLCQKIKSGCIVPLKT